MNLAEIRRKALTAETLSDYPAAQRLALPASDGAHRSPAPAESTEPSEPSEPHAHAPVPVASPEPIDFFGRPEPTDVAFPAELRCEGEPDVFDPAEVILRGRQSAAFDEELSLTEEAASADLELLCFKVANEEYAISIMDIKEIIKPREVTEVPRVPSFVRGILSLRGNIIPIFDMRVRLGLPDATSSERERVVVVKRQEGFCGVLVDEVVQVVRIAQTGIEPPPVVLEGIDREFVRGIGRVAGRMLILLDMEKVLDVSLL